MQQRLSWIFFILSFNTVHHSIYSYDLNSFICIFMLSEVIDGDTDVQLEKSIEG